MPAMLNTFDHLITPLEAFYHWEDTKPDEVWLRQPLGSAVREYTWREAGRQARCMASYLRSLNLPSGSHIGLFSKNCPHWIMADLAIWMAGHVSVPLYPTLNTETIRYTLSHSDCKVCFIGRLDHWSAIRTGIPDSVRCIGFPYGTAPELPCWDRLVEDNEPVAGDPPRYLEEVATIIYTSGTTGNPKGVVHKFLAPAYALAGILSVFPLRQERFFSYLPLSHVAERAFVEMGSLYTGSVVTFAESLETFAENLRDGAPTLFLGVPRIWTKFQEKILAQIPAERLNLLLRVPIVSRLLRRKIRAALGLQNCRYGLSGAAPITPELLAWYDRLGIEILEGYGMTENFGYSHFSFPGNRRIGSVGQAVPNASVRISEEGEIQVKSPCSLVGYYKEPEKTREVFADGYLRTGDQGVIEGEDFLRITGRIKDIFKTTKGKYVVPSPIEQQIEQDPLIDQICLVGVNIAQPVALVRLSEVALNLDSVGITRQLEAILDRLNPRLEPHERVSHVVICAQEWSIENNMLTPTLKIRRNSVEAQYMDRLPLWSTHPDRVVWEV